MARFSAAASLLRLSVSALLFGLVAREQALAQPVSTYAFSQPVGSYVPYIGGTLVLQTDFTTAAASALDDGNITLPNGTLPFTFNFAGTGYTGLNINFNGAVTFGATLPAGLPTNIIASTTAFDGCIAAHNQDLSGGSLSRRIGPPEVRHS